MMTNDYYVLREVDGGDYLTNDRHGFFTWAPSLEEAHREESIAELLNWYRYTPLNNDSRVAQVYKFDIVKISTTIISSEEVVK